jgi:hypothetical protein
VRDQVSHPHKTTGKVMVFYSTQNWFLHVINF